MEDGDTGDCIDFDSDADSNGNGKLHAYAVKESLKAIFSTITQKSDNLFGGFVGNVYFCKRKLKNER